MSFDADGMRWDTDGASGKTAWRRFVRWYEGETVILRYPSTDLFNIFPKRAFSAEQWQTCATSWQEHVPSLGGCTYNCVIPTTIALDNEVAEIARRYARSRGVSP